MFALIQCSTVRNSAALDAACLDWIKCFCDVTLISSCHHGLILFLFVESSLMAPQQVWLWSIFIFKVATDMFSPLSSSWSFGKLLDLWAEVDCTVRLCPLSVVSACQCRTNWDWLWLWRTFWSSSVYVCEWTGPVVRDTKQMPDPAGWDQQFYTYCGPKGPIKPWQLHPEQQHRNRGWWVNERAAQEGADRTKDMDTSLKNMSSCLGSVMHMSVLRNYVCLSGAGLGLSSLPVSQVKDRQPRDLTKLAPRPTRDLPLGITLLFLTFCLWTFTSMFHVQSCHPPDT